MYGYVEWTDRKKRIKAEERRIVGTRMLGVSIPRKPAFLQRRRCAAAAEILRQTGGTRVVFPAGFQQYEVFAERGILPVDPYILWQALAAELVQFHLEQSGLQGKSVTIAVCADRLTDVIRRTVTELCVRSRYVILCTPDRDDNLCRRLRREYGVSLVQTSDASAFSDVAVTLCFSPGGEMHGGNVLDLYAGGTPLNVAVELPEKIEAQLPVGCERMQLLTALFSAGSVRRGQIRLVSLQTPETE